MSDLENKQLNSETKIPETADIMKDIWKYSLGEKFLEKGKQELENSLTEQEKIKFEIIVDRFNVGISALKDGLFFNDKYSNSTEHPLNIGEKEYKITINKNSMQILNVNENKLITCKFIGLSEEEFLDSGKIHLQSELFENNTKIADGKYKLEVKSTYDGLRSAHIKDDFEVLVKLFEQINLFLGNFHDIYELIKGEKVTEMFNKLSTIYLKNELPNVLPSKLNNFGFFDGFVYNDLEFNIFTVGKQYGYSKIEEKFKEWLEQISELKRLDKELDSFK